jgi:hypothetical protein
MKQKSLLRSEKALGQIDVCLWTPEEFTAEHIGSWKTIPRDRADAFLARGVRIRTTKKMALEEHSAIVETALMFGYSVPVSSVQFHGLPLPQGYVQEGDFYVKRPRRRPPHRCKPVAQIGQTRRETSQRQFDKVSNAQKRANAVDGIV